MTASIYTRPDRERVALCRSLANEAWRQLAASRATAVDARALLVATRRLVKDRHSEAGGVPSSLLAVREERAREQVAAVRLLEWEADDLARVVPDEMTTPRRRFAIALYEAVALSRSLGMSPERLAFHLEYALRQVEAAD